MQNQKSWIQLFFVLLFAFSFVGCADKTANYYYYETGALSAPLLASFIVKDDKDNGYDGKKDFSISSDVKSLFFSVVIKNPTRMDYQIWSEGFSDGGNKLFSNKLYFSNAEDNSNNPFKVECPLDIPNRKIFFVVSVRNSREQVLFELLPLEYKVVKREEDWRKKGGNF
ncbi:hypothetical protein KKG48_00290 [Patescibacteria group bacterium]|nr:hypothetical protein [Patescibacteria group bacterium]MCG2694935.1 hypothetical protein [Candidatus Parcubacteria bacterium]